MTSFEQKLCSFFLAFEGFSASCAAYPKTNLHKIYKCCDLIHNPRYPSTSSERVFKQGERIQDKETLIKENPASVRVGFLSSTVCSGCFLHGELCPWTCSVLFAIAHGDVVPQSRTTIQIRTKTNLKAFKQKRTTVGA